MSSGLNRGHDKFTGHRQARGIATVRARRIHRAQRIIPPRLSGFGHLQQVGPQAVNLGMLALCQVAQRFQFRDMEAPRDSENQAARGHGLPCPAGNGLCTGVGRMPAMIAWMDAISAAESGQGSLSFLSASCA